MSKKITFVVSSPAVSDTLEKSYPAQWNIPALVEIKDTRKGSRRGRVFLRYISYEKECYVDKQGTEFSLQKYKTGEAPRLTQPSFVGGFLKVDEDDHALLNFLRTHPYNVTNSEVNEHKGKKFLEINQEKIAQERIQGVKSEFDTLKLVFEMSSADLTRTALLTGIITPQRMYDKKLDEIRHDLIVLIKRDPEEFYDAISDELADYKSLIFDAINLGILMTDGNNTLVFSNGNRFASVTTGEDVIEAGADKLADKGNYDILKMIKRRISAEKGEDTVAHSEEELQVKKDNVDAKEELLSDDDALEKEVNSLTVESLVELSAETKEIFESKPPYYILNGQKLYIGKGSFKYKKAAVQFLKDNEKNLEELKTRYYLYRNSNS